MLARSLHWMDASMTDYKCSIGILSSFERVLENFPIFLTVLQYWVPPNVPLSENVGHPVILHPSPNPLAQALGTIFFEEVQYWYVSLHMIMLFKNRMARFGYGPNAVTVAQVDNI